MTGKDFDDFLAWYNEKPQSRSIEIIIDKYRKPKAWVYDHELSVGQFAEHIEEVDLEKKVNENQRREYEKLKAKFEGGSVENK
jgi:hypothetical protein